MRAVPEPGEPWTASVDLLSRGDLDHDAVLRARLGARYGSPAYVCALLEGGIGVLVRGAVVATLREFRLESDDGAVNGRIVDPTTWALICSAGDLLPRSVNRRWSRQLWVSVKQGLAGRVLRLVRERDAYRVRN
jgi:hypothetical protein